MLKNSKEYSKEFQRTLRNATNDIFAATWLMGIKKKKVCGLDKLTTSYKKRGACSYLRLKI